MPNFLSTVAIVRLVASDEIGQILIAQRFLFQRVEDVVGYKYSYSFAVDKQHIICRADFGLPFTHGLALAAGEIDFLLYCPASSD